MGDKSPGRGVPGGWSHGGSEIDTIPCYARPGDEGVATAKQRVFRIAECIVSQVVIIDSAIIRLVMGAESAVTVAEAMWAIHELTVSGGLVAKVRPFVTGEAYPVTDDKPPAGLSMAAGPLHMVGNNSHWGILWFSINHVRLREIQQSATTRTDASATFREKCILEAIGDGELSGPEIAAKAGYEYNSHLRMAISNMVKRGLIHKGDHGYLVVT